MDFDPLIEGVLSNVPDDKFTGDYQDIWVACFNWIVTADETNTNPHIE